MTISEYALTWAFAWNSHGCRLKASRIILPDPRFEILGTAIPTSAATTAWATSAVSTTTWR